MSEPSPSRILEELASDIASAFEGMTGERPETALSGSAAPEPGVLLRRQSFAGAPGALWMAAAEADWTAGGTLVVEAAGLAETDQEKVKAEFLEILNQAVSGMARALSSWLNRGIRPEPIEPADTPPPSIEWTAIQFQQGAARFVLRAAVEPPLVAMLPGEESAGELVHRNPPTFDLLLDVELPISVSFGRAQVPLKDVLKLTTGSIVELDRAIADPVEIIVNNCVIARGEVVTVEGNFGVRIAEVVSRHERWKTIG